MGIAYRFYLDSWVEMRSQAREKLFVLHKGVIERLRPLFCLFGRDICGLITKDMKLFWRDISQWLQFLIFFGILGVYFLNIRNFSYNMLQPFWKNICVFLNLTATLLTLGSLSTRFIFPQISLEGNKFWIIGLAPIGLKKVLYQKFWMSVIISLVITEILIITSNRMLGVSGIMMSASLWTVFIMSFALVGLSVGLGASFPDFKSENPARIVSGFGGTLTLILSIGSILITMGLLIFPFQLFLKGHISTYLDLKKAVFISMGLVSLVGLGLCLAPLLYGERKLAAAEF
jgi:ABC-2 type transport system permease protein